MADPLRTYPRHSGYLRTAAMRLVCTTAMIALPMLPARLHAQHWEHCGGEVSTGNISAIIPGDLGILYALRYTWPCQNLWDEQLYTIFASSDHGATWSMVQDSVSNECFQYNSAGLFTAKPQKVLTGSGSMKENLILQSTNGGADWRPVPGAGPSGMLITNNRGVLVTTACTTVSDDTLQTTLSISADNGRTWTQRKSPFGSVYSGMITADGTIFFSGYLSATMDGKATALYRSSNLGATWTAVRERTIAWQMASSPTNADELFAAVSDPIPGADGGLIRSTDGGRTWKMMHVGNATRTIVLDGSGLVIIDDDNSRFRSSDHGVTWQLVPTVGTMLPAENGEIFALSMGFVTRSTNYGLSWRDITEGLDGNDVQCLGRDAEGNIYAGTAVHGMYRLVMNGTAGIHTADAGTGSVAPSLELPWPNPFEESTSITYMLARGTEIHLGLYDPVGGETRRLADGWMPAGAHQASIDREGLAPGVYFIRLSAEGRTLTRSLTVR